MCAGISFRSLFSDQLQNDGRASCTKIEGRTNFHRAVITDERDELVIDGNREWVTLKTVIVGTFQRLELDGMKNRIPYVTDRLRLNR
jgi:hypothetical protein